MGSSMLDLPRHSLGWTAYAVSQIGISTADYDVIFIRADFDSSGCVMNDVSTGFSQYLGVQARFSPERKDTRLDTRQEHNYEAIVDDASTMRVLFYDVPAKGSWLVDGADAILHISRAYLSSSHAAPSRFNFSNRLIESFRHREDGICGLATSRAVLRDIGNRMMPVSLDDDADLDPSFSMAALTADKPEQDRLQFQHIVSRNYERLREMLGHQAKLKEAQSWNLSISKHPFTVRLEGFGFADMVSGQPQLRLRYADLKFSRPNWLKMITMNSTICSLGSGFGNLLTSNSTCSKCTNVPPGFESLAAPARLLWDMAKCWGGVQQDHLEVVEKVYWNRPDHPFTGEHCQCTSPGHGAYKLKLNLDWTPAKPSLKAQWLSGALRT